MAPVQQVILQNDQCYSLEDNIIKGPEKPIDLISFNIGEVLLDAFNKNPNHISQIDAETCRKTTYAEMKDHAVRCALWIEKQKLASDDIIALYSYNNLDAYIPVFASYLSQTIITSWALELTLDFTRQSLRLFSPKLIFAQPHLIEVLEEALSLENLSVKIIVLGEHPNYQSLNDIMQSQSSDEVNNYRASTRKNCSRDVAVIIESSGSTGLPKGVMISSKALLTNAFNDELCFGNNEEQINSLWLNPPMGVMSCCLVISCILKNSTRIICNSKDPIEIGKIIDKYKVNYAGVYPMFLDLLARSEELNRYNIECLKVMRTGGSKLNGATFRTLKSSCLADKIHQGYGTTEIGSGCIRPLLNHYQKSRHSIGYLAGNIQLKIVDRVTNKILGANKVGELLIKSPSMMLGYYKNTKATRKVIDSEGWYHTGDVGYYDEKGEVFIMDRIVDVFEYRGQEYFSSEIEDVLYSLPAVMDVVVLAVPHELDGETPVAFITTRPGYNVTKRQIAELLVTFKRYKTLHLNVCFLKEIPRNVVHKINKKLLKELALYISYEQ